MKDPRFVDLKAKHRDRVLAGNDTPGDTLKSRVDVLEHFLEIVMLSPRVRETVAEITIGGQALARGKRHEALSKEPAEIRSAAILAMSDHDLPNWPSELKRFAHHHVRGPEDIDQVVDLAPEARDRILSVMEPHRAAAIVFQLLPLADIEHVRVTTLAGKAPVVNLVPKAQAPEGDDATIFVDAVPEAVSRATALATWNKTPAETRRLPELE